MLDLYLVILFKQLTISSKKVLSTTSEVSRALSLTLIVCQNSVIACNNQQKLKNNLKQVLAFLSINYELIALVNNALKGLNSF